LIGILADSLADQRTTFLTPEQLTRRNAAIRKAWNDPLRLAQALGMSKTGVIKQFHRWAP